MTQPMQIQTHTDPTDCFQNLAAEWHDLLDRSMVNQVFMTPEFQQAWWSTLGSGELNLLTIRDEQQVLRGIAPIYKFKNDQGIEQFSFIGCVNVSDYLDFIVDREMVELVYASISEYLQHSEIKMTFFCSIPVTSPTLTVFKSVLEKSGWQVAQTQQDVCPVITLPTTWDEYLASIGKKQRHEIKRKWEKLFAETTAEFELIELPTATEDAMTDFIHLHQASSQDKSNFWDDNHVQFFKYFAEKTAEKSWLKLYFLKIDGRRVAAMLGFSYHQQFFLYNSGFVAEEYRQYGIGSVLTAYTIQQSILRGESRYDFLRGDEEYKFRFRAVAEPVFDLKSTR